MLEREGDFVFRSKTPYEDRHHMEREIVHASIEAKQEGFDFTVDDGDFNNCLKLLDADIANNQGSMSPPLPVAAQNFRAYTPYP